MNLSRYGGAYNGALIDSAVQEYNLKTGKLAAQLGRARPHPAGRLLRVAADQRVPLGRLPRQLDRPDRQRHLPRLDAQHLGRLPGQHRHRQDRVDPRRQALELQVRPGRRLPVAARRQRWQPRLDGHACSTTTAASSPAEAPTSRRPALARARAQARPAHAHGDARGPVRHRRRQFESEYMGDTQPLPNGNVFVGWGSAPYFSEYSRVGQAAARRGVPGAGPQLPGDASSSGSACRSPRPSAPRARRTARPRCTRAGTAPPRSRPGGSWPDPSAARLIGRGDAPPGPGSRRRSRCPRATRASRSRRSAPAAG